MLWRVLHAPFGARRANGHAMTNYEPANAKTMTDAEPNKLAEGRLPFGQLCTTPLGIIPPLAIGSARNAAAHNFDVTLGERRA
jgi:hypothetical protein